MKKKNKEIKLSPAQHTVLTAVAGYTTFTPFEGNDKTLQALETRGLIARDKTQTRVKSTVAGRKAVT